MATLPTTPAPSSVSIDVTQPSANKPAIDGVSRQARSRGTFIITASFTYSLLDFDERDILESFLIDQSGMVSAFDVTIPTRSENNGVTSITGTFASAYATNTTTVTINGIVGALKRNHLLRVNGKKATYIVMSAGAVVGGSQQVRIKPPLRYPVALNDVVITKDVTLNMHLDSDSVSTNFKGMTATIKFNLIEDPRS